MPVHDRTLGALFRQDSAPRAAATAHCPSCGEPVPPRRRFCTEQCRTALHRIRRTESDIARLRDLLDPTRMPPTGELEPHWRDAYARQLQVLEERAEERHQRLAAHREAQTAHLPGPRAPEHGS